MPSSRWRLSAETVTAAAAVVTAAVALAIGVWQMAETRRFNRLSVQPRLVFETEIAVPDGLDGPAAPGALELRVSVRNRGLGLADVLGTDIHVRPRSGEAQTYASWDEAVPAIEAYGVEVGTREVLRDGDLLNVGDEVTLVALRNAAPLTVDSLKVVAGRINVEVRYESLYREPFGARLRDRRTFDE